MLCEDCKRNMWCPIKDDKETISECPHYRPSAAKIVLPCNIGDTIYEIALDADLKYYASPETVVHMQIDLPSNDITICTDMGSKYDISRRCRGICFSKEEADAVVKEWNSK